MTTPTTRNMLVGLVHLAKSKLGYNDTEYREYLEQLTGRRSCKDMSDHQLDQLVAHLREQGVLEPSRKPPRKCRGGSGADRPSPKQLAYLDHLSKMKGFDGLEDARLLAFVRRVAKVDGLRFLDRRLISKVITGLRKWIDAEERRREEKGETPE